MHPRLLRVIFVRDAVWGVFYVVTRLLKFHIFFFFVVVLTFSLIDTGMEPFGLCMWIILWHFDNWSGMGASWSEWKHRPEEQITATNNVLNINSALKQWCFLPGLFHGIKQSFAFFWKFREIKAEPEWTSIRESMKQRSSVETYVCVWYFWG